MTQISNFPFKIQMSKNKFLIEKYDNQRVDIKMYMIEISNFKISDLKAQKMIILWTMKHVSAIRKHPVFIRVFCNVLFFNHLNKNANSDVV